MSTGALLLAAARAATPDHLRVLAGPDEARAALVAALLTSRRPDDAPLLRELTRLEIGSVDAAGDGCGDVLLACCWMLFLVGDLADVELIWQAKNLNFDTYSYIDSVFLIPSGVQMTAEFANAHGPADLADYVQQGWLTDPDELAEQWRNSAFFAGAPAATASVEELARYIRS